MRFSASVLLALIPLALANPIAEAGGELVQRAACTVTGKGGLNGAGNCQTVASCGGVSVPGFCPGANNIQCCRWVACSGSKSAHFCKNTSKGCNYTGYRFWPNYCPGDSTVQCCAD